MARIEEIATECLNDIAGLLAVAVSDRSCVTSFLRGRDIQQMQERYEQWAGNLGALQHFKSPLSLEHRLRDAPLVRETILNTLEDLHVSIQAATDITTGKRVNRVSDPSNIALGTDPSGENVSSSESDTSSTPSTNSERNALVPTSEIEELVAAIKTSLDNLFRSSVFIRKFSPKTKRLKAAETKPFDNRADIMHIEDRYPVLRQKNAALAARLGEANSRRRQYFKYRRDHNERLSAVTIRDDFHNSATIFKQKSKITVEENKSRSAITENTNASQFVETEATALLADAAQEARMHEVQLGPSAMSSVSLVTSVAYSSDEDMPFPTVPAEAQTGSPFLCPYCLTIQQLKCHRSESQWKKHVLNDLEPYICTFSSCGLDSFQSQHAWFEHELLVHRSRWICSQCLLFFESSNDLKRHIRQLHHDIISDLQVSAIVDLSKRPIETIQPDECPFCDNLMKKEDLEFKAGEEFLAIDLDWFRQHLGRHLEEAALFALPRLNQDDDRSLVSDDFRGHPDQDVMSKGFRWVRDDCGRGWSIISRRRTTFIALACFLSSDRTWSKSVGQTSKANQTSPEHKHSEGVLNDEYQGLLDEAAEQRVGNERIDLIIGIDFGMACTGVAYTNLSSGSNTVKCIQNWPGNAHANEKKVPTVLVYEHPIDNTTDRTTLYSWGFLAEPRAEQMNDFKHWFKHYLDPVELAERQAADPVCPFSMKEVETWYEDYLQMLYKYIQLKLGPELLRTSWQKANVEFIFSVPKTWTPPTVARFRSITKRAGFGAERSHTLSVGLTEAEAAAIYTFLELSDIFEEGQIVLICNAGGATTDVSVMRVSGTSKESLSLKELDISFGAKTGSATIDYGFSLLVQKRMENMDLSTTDRQGIAWEMMKGHEFQNIKCAHGCPNDDPIFSIRIPQVYTGCFDNVQGVENGHMEFSRWELQKLFDEQSQKLTLLIDKQLTRMQQKFPNEQVAYLILSGGLGHSPSVQERLRSRYTLGALHPNARGIQVRVVPDPELAVCKGLVVDRLNKTRSRVSISSWRLCCASYGALYKEVYDPENQPHHIGRQIILDAVTGKKFVTQSVAWFIKKGERVPPGRTITTRGFRTAFPPGDSQRFISTSIVVCYLDSSLLVPYMTADAQISCEIKSDLSSADDVIFKQKNKGLRKLGKYYHEVEYQIKALIGPANIRFELLLNGKKINNDQVIKVDLETIEL